MAVMEGGAAIETRFKMHCVHYLFFVEEPTTLFGRNKQTSKIMKV